MLFNKSANEQIAYLKLILDSTAEGFYAVDTEGHTTACNAAFLRMLGYTSADDVLGRKLHGEIHHTHPDGSYYPVETCPIYNAASQGKGKFVPYEFFYRKDGSSFPVEYRAEPIIEDGILKGAICTFSDISERVKNENDIRLANDRVQIALNAGILNGTFVWDIVNDKLRGDERFAKLFSISLPEAISGVPISQAMSAIHPDDLGYVEHEVNKVLQQEGGFYNATYRLKNGDEWRWVQASGKVDFNAKGEPVEFPGIISDVDLRKREELLYREAQEHLRLAQSAGGIGLFSVDIQANTIEASEEFYKVFGLQDNGDKSPSQFEHLVIEEDQQLVSKDADRKSGNIILDAEYRIRKGVGEEIRWLSRRSEITFDAEGKPERMIGAVIDITDRKKLQLEAEASRRLAEQANIAKTEFLANMSHEIRTPMNAIIGLTSILSMSAPLTEKQRQFITTLKSSSDGLLVLINDLLDISKIEARSVELEQIPFSVSQMVQEVISMMAVRVKEKNLVFTGDGDCVDSSMFVGDPTRLRQIVLNLCSNAIKFTEKGGVHLSITSQAADNSEYETICIEVADTGIGIAPENLEKVFDKFSQADNTINRKYGGTGLGLTITKNLVEVMGGTIKVDSEVGKGSTFTACIPLRRVPSSEVEKITETLQQAIETTLDTKRGARLLLAEDYEPNVIVAQAILEGYGYKVDVVKNGNDALIESKTRAYSAILMDVQMHGMNGLEATFHIRDHERQHALSRVPIIGMTAHALAGDRERCLSAGMDEYISKPFKGDDLNEIIKRVVHKKI